MCVSRRTVFLGVPFCRPAGRLHAALVVAAWGDGMACMALDVDLLALRFQQDNFLRWSITNNSK